MRIPKRTAMGLSGLVIAGTAIIGVGAATPASANGCCGGGHHKSLGSAHVRNHNFNFSRSHSLEAQHLRQNQRHFNHHNDFFHHEEDEGKKMKGGHDGDGHEW